MQGPRERGKRGSGLERGARRRHGARQRRPAGEGGLRGVPASTRVAHRFRDAGGVEAVGGGHPAVCVPAPGGENARRRHRVHDDVDGRHDLPRGIFQLVREIRALAPLLLFLPQLDRHHGSPLLV